MTDRTRRLLEGWAVWVQYGLVPLALIPVERPEPRPAATVLAQCDAYEPRTKSKPDLAAWLAVECAVERCPRCHRPAIRAYLRESYIEMRPAVIDGAVWDRFERELG